MKKSFVVLNVILIVYILSLSVGYAFFKDSLNIKGVASTVDFYSGDKLPVTSEIKNVENNGYHLSSNVPTGITYDSESWEDNTYVLNYKKSDDIIINTPTTTQFTITLTNASALSYTEGMANIVSQNNSTTMLFNASPTPLSYKSNSSFGIKKLASNDSGIINSSVSISKTFVEPGESFDVNFSIETRFLSSTGTDTTKATISYMLQGKRRYFHFIVNLIGAKRYYTFTINPTPSDATVNINGKETKQITVLEGTEVSYSVSKTNYGTKSGKEIVNSDIVKNVNLTELTHNWGNWVITKAATCTEAGVEERTCSQCGAKETRSLPALGHNHSLTKTVAPSYSGIGYKEYTCSRCGDTYRENTTDPLYLVKDKKLVNQGDWSTAFNNTTESTLNPSSGFGGKVNYSIATLAVSMVNNHGAAWTPKINLTDAKKVSFSYVMYDNLYKEWKECSYNVSLSLCIKNKIIKKYQKGQNTATFGIATSNQLNKDQGFVSGKSSTVVYNRTSANDSVKESGNSPIEIDVSDLKGDYYIKIYTKHSYTEESNTNANTAFTGLVEVKITY